VRDDEAIARGPTELNNPGGNEGPTEPGSEVLAAGTFAGDYKVLRHLGSGAMGDVYAGVHPVIGKDVAIKVIKRKLAGSEEAAERFVREARAVNQVRHPNVADVFSFGRLDDGRLFLVMDYLEGESLGARLRRDGAYDVDEFLAVITPVCEALHAAHSKNVIHRDLKPDNVFLAKTEDGRERVYVLDFGIAKILSDVSSDTARGTLTGEGVWMGTPAYMAPEQWTAEGASPQSDIYALGTMAFEMLNGAVPYQAKSVPAIMEKHFHADVPALTTSGGVLLPEGISEAIRIAMAKKPDERFANADEFLTAVRDGAAGGGTMRKSRRRAAVAASLDDREHSMSRPMVWAGLGGIGVLAIGLLVLFVVKGSTKDKPTADNPAVTKPGLLRVPIITQPKGARILRDGDHVGSTPYSIEAKADERIRVRLTKPGYAPIVREVIAADGAKMDVTLPPVTGFKGVWRLPKGALRAFQRRGDRVAGFKLASVQGSGIFLRFFEFVPSEGDTVAFAATENHIDEKAPNEPSCRIPLRAEYRFHPARDHLEIRAELVQYDTVDGRCIVRKKRWGPFEKVTRLASAADSETVWATSSAGAGPIRALKTDRTVQARGTKNKAKPKKRLLKGARNRRKNAKSPVQRKQAKQAQRVKKTPPKLDNKMELNSDQQANRPQTRINTKNTKNANSTLGNAAANKNANPRAKQPPGRKTNQAATPRPSPRTQGSAAQRGTPSKRLKK